MSVNKVILVGNVGKDPEVRPLESGAAVAAFPLATTERYKDKSGVLQDQTEWHNIICWRNLAELAEKYINKGSQLYIEGKIRTRSWTDKEGAKRYTTEIVADNIRLLGKRESSSENNGFNTTAQPQAAQPQSNTQGALGNDFPAEDSSDDLPF